LAFHGSSILWGKAYFWDIEMRITAMSKILKVNKLKKSYNSGESRLTVLDDITFEVSAGTTFAMVGPSGSGKTTLLGLCAGLDTADEGDIELCGQLLSKLNEDKRAALRNQKIGFIFQNFQLLPTLTALENVCVPLELQGHRSARIQALELLEKVGLGKRGNHYPSQLSGGEQQRVALARAFANSPEVLFADEPTGNLDDETGSRVIDLLFNLNKEAGTTLIIVTHDMELAGKCDSILRLKGGRIVDNTQHFSDEK
jgi:putative ABC transport system ATP-binding protein